MANRILQNVGLLSGNYNGAEIVDSPSSVVSVTLVDVTFTKEADRDMWFSGELGLKFTIDNTLGVGPLTDIVVADTLDETKFSYVANSVVVQISNGASPMVLDPDDDYTVEYTQSMSTETGLLRVSFVSGGRVNPIPAGSVVTISFRGAKVL